MQNDERFVTDDPNTTVVTIQQGQRIRVVPADSDGHFDVSYGYNEERSLEVSSDQNFPDDTGRCGDLYRHYYGEGTAKLVREVETMTS